MIIRYLIATLGALAITIGLLIFMKDVTTRYVNDDPIRYFRILDFIPGPDRGRERIQPPSDPRLAPSVPELEQEPLEAPRQQLDPSPDITIEPEILRAPVVPESA
jgi:hypothetical protein